MLEGKLKMEDSISNLKNERLNLK
jgi:chromosome segregation ATPase